jgi:hypothetical protein
MLLLYRIRLMLVCAVEPVAQMRRRLVRRFSVEGHHSRGNAWNPDDMRSPAFFGHPRHLDDEDAPGNSSFQTVAHFV